MKIVAAVFLIIGIWMVTSIRNIDRKAGKKENIITIIIFLIGCLLLYTSLKIMGTKIL
jgi:predicted small integral membrane protein